MRQDEEKKYIFVNDFGAVGDGVHDDTQAILDAMDYAGTYSEQKCLCKFVLQVHQKDSIKSQGWTFQAIFRLEHGRASANVELNILMKLHLE